MLNNNLEAHLVRLKINLKKLYLKVRFPCSVSFQLKNQTQIIETSSSYPMKNNEALINEDLDLEMEAEYNPTRHQYEPDTKVSIVVHMISSNGKVIAGSVKLSIFDKANLNVKTDYSLSLDKCPDKNSKLFFNATVQYIKTVSSNNHADDLLQKSRYSYINDLKHLSPRNMVPPQSPIKSSTTANRKSFNTSKNYTNGINRPHIDSMNDKDFQNRRIGENYTIHSHREQYQEPEFGGYRKNPNSKAKYTLSHAGSEMLIKSQKIADEKYFSPEKYGQVGVKKHQIEKLKTEMSYRHREEMASYENRISQHKVEIENLSHEVEVYKEKLKGAERRESNLQMSIKELKDELEKKKTKCADIGQKLNATEAQLQAKTKELKQESFDKNKINEQLQKIRIEHKTQQKKLTFKIDSLKQEVKKYEVKFKDSQTKGEASVHELNAMLNKLQESQKKALIALREKQKSYSEEKNKLSKKVDSLTANVRVLEEKLSSASQKANNASSENKMQLKRENQKNLVIQNLTDQLSAVTLRLQRSQQQKNIVEEEIQDKYKPLETEFNALKRQNLETQHEISTLKSNRTKLEAEKVSLEQQLSHQNEQIKHQKQQNKTLSSSITMCKRETEELNKQIAKIHKEKQLTEADLVSSNRKLYEAKGETEYNRSKYEDIITKCEDKINMLLRTKANLEKEYEELKWSLDKSKEFNEDLNYQYKSANSEILSLNESIFEKNEEIRHFKEGVQELKIQTENLRTENDVLTLRIKETSVNLKQKESQAYELKKKVQEYEQEQFMLKDKISHMEGTFRQTSQNIERKQREKEEIMDLKSNELSEAEVKINSLREQITTLKQTVSLGLKQNDHLKMTSQQIKLENTAMEQELYRLKQTCTELREASNEAQLANSTKEELIKRQEKQISKVTAEHEKYQQIIVLSLENLLAELSKEEEKNVGVITATTLKGIIDPKISKLQIELIQARNTHVLEHRTKVFEMEAALKLANAEIAKLTKHLEEQQKETENVIVKERTRNKALETEYRDEKNILLQEIKTLEGKNFEKLSEVEKYHVELNRQCEISQEQNIQINILMGQYETLKEEYSAAEEKINQLRLDEIRSKAHSEGKFNEMSEHFEEIIDGLRKTVLELERQTITSQNSIVEKEELLKGQNSELNQLKFTIDSQNEKISEMESNYKSLEKREGEKDKRVKQQQKELKKLASLIDELHQTVSKVNLKTEQTQIKNKKLESDLNSAEVTIQRLKLEQQSDRARQNEMQEIIKSTGQSYKVQLEKYLQEIRSGKEQVIKHKSEIDLKGFQIKQLQESQNLLKEEVRSGTHQMNKKRTEFQEQETELENFKREFYETQAKMKALIQQKIDIQNQLTAKLNLIQNLRSKVARIPALEEQLEKKDRDLLRSKQQRSNLDRENEKQIQKYKKQNRELKSNNERLSFSNEESKRKIRELEYYLQNTDSEFYEQKRRYDLSMSREKEGIIKRIEEIQASKSMLQEEFLFEREQLQKEVADITSQYNDLVDSVKLINADRSSLQQKFEYSESKSQELTDQLHKANRQVQESQARIAELQEFLKNSQAKQQELKASHAEKQRKLQKIFRDLQKEINLEREQSIKHIETLKDQNSVNVVTDAFNRLTHTCKSATRSIESS